MSAYAGRVSLVAEGLCVDSRRCNHASVHGVLRLQGSNQATSDESTAAVPHMRPLGGAGDPRAPAHLRSGVVNPEEDVAYLRSLSLDDRPTHAHPRAHHDHGGHAHAHAAAGRSGSSGRAMNGAQRGAHPAAHARAMAAVDPSDGPISNGL